MERATANIPPHVLAAALQDVEGTACDLSTESGMQAAAELAARLMKDERTLEPLLTALEKRENFELADVDLPLAFGQVVMESDAVAIDSTLGMPPTGSPEFDEFMADTHAQVAAEPHEVILLDKVVSPSLLGFAQVTAEPVTFATLKEFDTIFRDAQRQLMVRAVRSHRAEGLLSRVFSAVFRSPSSSSSVLRVATQTAQNYTAVKVIMGASTKLHFHSVVSGKDMFVLVAIDGKVAMKDRISLSDHVKAVQRFTEVFAQDAEAGAEMLHELRDANASRTDQTIPGGTSLWSVSS